MNEKHVCHGHVWYLETSFLLNNSVVLVELNEAWLNTHCGILNNFFVFQIFVLILVQMINKPKELNKRTAQVKRSLKHATQNKSTYFVQHQRQQHTNYTYPMPIGY